MRTPSVTLVISFATDKLNEFSFKVACMNNSIERPLTGMNIGIGLVIGCPARK
jgi:hypothetical protein